MALARDAHLAIGMKLRFVATFGAALLIACGGGNKTSGKTGLDASGRPLPVARDDEGKGVSLTGEHPYDDRHDSSGWSGKTALPGAIGGGPTPSASASASPPAPTPSVAPPAPPSPSASPLPPSKELDTAPPSKELQF